MKYTSNYGLRKPEQEEYYNVDVFNTNADVVDSKLKELTENHLLALSHGGPITDANSITNLTDYKNNRIYTCAGAANTPTPYGLLIVLKAGTYSVVKQIYIDTYNNRLFTRFCGETEGECGAWVEYATTDTVIKFVNEVNDKIPFVYKCTGENDDLAIQNIVNDFFGQLQAPVFNTAGLIKKHGENKNISEGTTLVFDGIENSISLVPTYRSFRKKNQGDSPCASLY